MSNSGDYVDWSKTVRDDFLGMFVGERLGEGQGRIVYTIQHMPGKVVKVEQNAHSFQNIAEWQLWNEVKGTEWARWFAPCRMISACGSVMIQNRTEPLRCHPKKGWEFPKELPNFFADLKPSNFGRIGKQVVAHDYGHSLIIANGLRRTRMRIITREDWEWGTKELGEST